MVSDVKCMQGKSFDSISKVGPHPFLVGGGVGTLKVEKMLRT